MVNPPHDHGISPLVKHRHAFFKQFLHVTGTSIEKASSRRNWVIHGFLWLLLHTGSAFLLNLEVPGIFSVLDHRGFHFIEYNIVPPSPPSPAMMDPFFSIHPVYSCMVIKSLCLQWLCNFQKRAGFQPSLLALTLFQTISGIDCLLWCKSQTQLESNWLALNNDQNGNNCHRLIDLNHQRAAILGSVTLL